MLRLSMTVLFGRQLAVATGVPVGIITISPTNPAESWMRSELLVATGTAP
jgi:hypothetical protein